METLLTRSTYEPAEKLDYNEMSRHIQRLGILSIAVADGLKDDPEQTIQMVRSLYRDNPCLVTKSLGIELISKII